ncbi:allantoate permease [Scheffersomyces xylosifermentans]|uniref:allantoate permease n=1 Tax=Scheffersomyces xylosifermentans TaxID=1304137 RepID=UPI00315C571A
MSDSSVNKDEKIVYNVVSFTEETLGKRDNVITTIVSPHTGKEVKITGDVDEAMKFAVAHAGQDVELTAARDRKLLWKIDLYLMPVICLLYCFQFMDKLSNSYASILGLRADLNMRGDMYSWTGSAFYLGYLVFEFPASRLLQRFPVAKTASCFIVLWGAILMLHSVPQYAGFIALRTILGMLESSVTVSNLIITGCFYRKEEVFLRVALWFSSNGLGIIIGSGAIAYNLVHDQENFSIEPWKLIFVITGSLTIGLGVLFFFHVPDTPAGAWWLTEEDKIMVVERIRANQQGFGNKHFKIKQFKEALLDHRTWLIFSYALFSNIPNGGLTNFGSILMTEDFGFTPKQALLMQIPEGVIEFVGCTFLAFSASYLVKSRMFWATFGTSIAVIGEFMLAFCSNSKARLAGLYLSFLLPIGFICLLSVISSNVAGHTKKVTVNAIYLIGYCVGNLIGPQTFLAQEAPGYRTAKICIVSFGTVSLVFLFAIWYSYWQENKIRDRNASKSEEELEMIENHEFADLTDKENLLFRYEY